MKKESQRVLTVGVCQIKSIKRKIYIMVEKHKELELYTINRGCCFASPFIFVYGALRKGHALHDRYISPSSTYIGTYRLQGFILGVTDRLYSCIHTGKETDTVVIEIYRIDTDLNDPFKSDKSIYKFVDMCQWNYKLDVLEERYKVAIITVEKGAMQITGKLYLSEKVKTLYKTGDVNNPKHFVDYPLLTIKKS